MIISASELGRTRLCRAANCPDDATTYGLLCNRHEEQRRRGVTVPLHVLPEQLPSTRRCSTCTQWKPEVQFADRIDRARKRSYCRECGHKAKRDARAKAKGQAESESDTAGTMRDTKSALSTPAHTANPGKGMT